MKKIDTTKRTQETHPIVRSEFRINVGEEEFIPYPSQKKPLKRKSGKERWR